MQACVPTKFYEYHVYIGAHNEQNNGSAILCNMVAGNQIQVLRMVD